MGITSCLGNTLDEVAESLHEGKSGITFSEEYEKLGIKSQVRGRPNLSAEEIKERGFGAGFIFMDLNLKIILI